MNETAARLAFSFHVLELVDTLSVYILIKGFYVLVVKMPVRNDHTLYHQPVSDC
jgi:hypothetical protein